MPRVEHQKSLQLKCRRLFLFPFTGSRSAAELPSDPFLDDAAHLLGTFRQRPVETVDDGPGTVAKTPDPFLHAARIREGSRRRADHQHGEPDAGEIRRFAAHFENVAHVAGGVNVAEVLERGRVFVDEGLQGVAASANISRALRSCALRL